MGKKLDSICISEPNILEDWSDNNSGFVGYKKHEWIFHTANCYEESGRIGVMIDDKKTIPPIYERIRLITTGIICQKVYAVVIRNGKSGLLSEQNEVIEDCIYDNFCFSYKPKQNNKLVSSIKFVRDSVFVYIDLFSNIRFESTINYDKVGLFQDSTNIWDRQSLENTRNPLADISKKMYAITKNGNSCGVILDDGVSLFESDKFKDIEGMFLCKNRKGDYVLRCDVVFHNGGKGWVNHEGKLFGSFNPNYKFMKDLKNGEYVAQNDSNKWGIIDENEKIVVEFIYESYNALMNRNNPVVKKPIEEDLTKNKKKGSKISTREKRTYERYSGSYAQDEMGYSDDDIDTIFEGDPSAYWNID